MRNNENQRWTVKKTDGTLYDPADTETIKKWIQEKRVLPEDYISPEGWERWQLAKSLAQFANLFQVKVEVPRVFRCTNCGLKLDYDFAKCPVCGGYGDGQVGIRARRQKTLRYIVIIPLIGCIAVVGYFGYNFFLNIRHQEHELASLKVELKRQIEELKQKERLVEKKAKSEIKLLTNRIEEEEKKKLEEEAKKIAREEDIEVRNVTSQGNKEGYFIRWTVKGDAFNTSKYPAPNVLVKVIFHSVASLAGGRDTTSSHYLRAGVRTDILKNLQPGQQRPLQVSLSGNEYDRSVLPNGYYWSYSLRPEITFEVEVIR